MAKTKTEPGAVRIEGQTVSVTIEIPKKLYKLAKRVYGGLGVRIEDMLIEDLIASLDTELQLSFGELAGWPEKISYRDEIEALARPEEAEAQEATMSKSKILDAEVKPVGKPDMAKLINDRLLEPRNLIRDGLKVAQGIEAMSTYLSIYADDVPGIMSVSSGTDLIIDAFERIEEQLVFLEEAVVKEAVHA